MASNGRLEKQREIGRHLQKLPVVGVTQIPNLRSLRRVTMSARGPLTVTTRS